MRDVKFFHESFYKRPDKIRQDNFILKHCSVSNPKRPRRRNEERSKPKSLSVKYHVKRRDGLIVNLCRQSFMDILGVKKDRILNIVKRYKQSNEMPRERRGGNRVKGKNDQKRAAIRNFVESLTCIESHYCRSKTFNRFYLPAELNIRKLWRMFNNKVTEDLQVKESFFRFFFTRKYNVGFGTPKTDLCSTCLQFKDQLKKTTENTIRDRLLTQQRVHKIRANCFYELLKEFQDDPEVVTWSFDCQKNLALPKIPDQSAYFSMQLNFYHFAMVQGSSKGKLNADSIRSYVWTELDHQRGSNEIASAVYHTLTTHGFSDQTKVVRLFCDGCGAQNKNSNVIGMLSDWLLNYSPPSIEKVEVVFPVVGHSYIPPDRLFGQIEKVIKRKPEITSPEQYVEIIRNWGSVYKLGVDVPVKDWKSKVQVIMKPPSQWHFKLQVSKRIIISKSKSGYAVRGESFYRNDTGTNQSLLRRGRKLRIEPTLVEIGVPLKPDKQKSISTLLQKHFGINWRNDGALSFFRNAFDENPIASFSNTKEDSEPTASTSTKEADLPQQVLTEENETEANTELFCLEEPVDFAI